MRVVNEVRVKIKTGRARTYSKTTSSAGASQKTSGGGGGGTVTSASGGPPRLTEATRTISAALRASQPIDADGNNIPYTESATASSGSPHRHYRVHYHAVNGSVLIPPIVLELEPHTHNVTTSSHTHIMDIPAHNHNIEFGIFYGTETPTAATVKINGKAAFSMGANYEGDITQYMLDENGEVPRGRFIDISVAPNTAAYVSIAVAPVAFIQSRQGGVY